MKEKFGTKPVTKKRKTEKKENEQDPGSASEEGSAKKLKATPQAVNPKNQPLIDELMDLCGFEFKNEEKFKGMALSKAGKSMREKIIPRI